MDKQVTMFSGVSCAPCHALKPIMAKLTAKHGLDFTLVSAGPNTQHEFQARGIRSVPTVVILDGETEIGRFTGLKTEEQVEQFLRTHEVI